MVLCVTIALRLRAPSCVLRQSTSIFGLTVTGIRHQPSWVLQNISSYSWTGSTANWVTSLFSQRLRETTFQTTSEALSRLSCDDYSGFTPIFCILISTKLLPMVPRRTCRLVFGISCTLLLSSPCFLAKKLNRWRMLWPPFTRSRSTSAWWRCECWPEAKAFPVDFVLLCLVIHQYSCDCRLDDWSQRMMEKLDEARRPARGWKTNESS